MKSISYFTLVIAIAALLLTMNACQLDAADWTYSTDNTMADLSFNDVYNLSSGEANGHNDLRSGGTVTLTPYSASVFFPATLSVDFGAGTVCSDGRTRSGIVTAVYSDRWSTLGMTCTVTTNNYKVAGYKVEGTNVITNQGIVSGSQTFRAVVTNGKVTTPEGDILTRESTYYWAWLAGAATPLNANDDVYQLTGDATGTTRNGNEYDATITTPVVKAVSCKWIQEGRVEVTPKGGGTVRAVDYGNGTCDATAEVSYGKWNMNIVMN